MSHDCSFLHGLQCVPGTFLSSAACLLSLRFLLPLPARGAGAEDLWCSHPAQLWERSSDPMASRSPCSGLSEHTCSIPSLPRHSFISGFRLLWQLAFLLLWTLAAGPFSALMPPFLCMLQPLLGSSTVTDPTRPAFHVCQSPVGQSCHYLSWPLLRWNLDPEKSRLGSVQLFNWTAQISQ